MKPNDLADATAHALDLLPLDDAARTDPRLRRDPILTEEARLTRETAAAVWLAVSPLRVAPPDVLTRILKEVGPYMQIPPASKKISAQVTTWLGWAAAAVFAFLLWHNREDDSTAALATNVFTAAQPPHQAPQATPATKPAPRNEGLREEVARLKARLDQMHAASITSAPRVMSLYSPGAVRRSPEEQEQRIRGILAAALRSTLEAKSGAPSDPASLVIERGWLVGGLPVPEDGTAIRHRNFPEESWQELGLLRSDEGQNYYDPRNKTLWTNDGPQQGFIGRQVTPEDDLSKFYQLADTNIAKATNDPLAPEGFIIPNPSNQTAQVIIDSLPPPAPGNAQILTYTNSFGNTEIVSLAQNPSLSSDHFITDNAISGTDFINFGSTSVITIPTVNGLNSITLTENPIIPNGLPPKIILQGGP